MKPYFVALVCAVALSPSVSLALQDIPAGFAPGALWLSKMSATAGESLKIFTVLYDSATSSIEGDVEFTVDSKALGTSHFKLAAGEAQILSHDWVAVAGAHTFGAVLKNVTGLSAASRARRRTR